MEIIVLSNLTYMISMTDHITINVKTLRIYNGYSLEKELIELIRISP